MKLTLNLVLLFLLSLLNACADGPHKPNNVAHDEVVEQGQTSPTMLHDVSFEQVMALNSEPDDSLKLAYGSEALQYGRLYLPEQNETQGHQTYAPLVIFIHGGCWLNAYGIEHSVAFSQSLAQQGFAVWSLEYRRTGDAGGGWPGSFNDILKGVSFAQSFKDYPIDLSNIVLTGHSAGGHLALLASAPERGLFKGDARLKGVIGLAAIVDVVAYSKGTNSCQTAAVDFFGGNAEQMPDAYELGSPLTSSLPANTLLLQGDVDSVVDRNQAIASGLKYKVVSGAGHFDWIHPGTTAYQTFLATLHERVSTP